MSSSIFPARDFCGLGRYRFADAYREWALRLMPNRTLLKLSQFCLEKFEGSFACRYRFLQGEVCQTTVP